MHWTGIGTRGFLTQEVINRQLFFGKVMAAQRHELWTGGALQSDYNFLKGACDHSSTTSNQQRQHVVRPVTMTSWSRPPYARPLVHLCEESDQLAAIEYFITKGIFKERNFLAMDNMAQLLHGRNFYQVMETMYRPRSELVVYAAKEDRWGNIAGGTRSAVTIARVEGIPHFNIRTEKGWKDLINHVESKSIVPIGVLR